MPSFNDVIVSVDGVPQALDRCRFIQYGRAVVMSVSLRCWLLPAEMSSCSHVAMRHCFGSVAVIRHEAFNDSRYAATADEYNYAGTRTKSLSIKSATSLIDDAAMAALTCWPLLAFRKPPLSGIMSEAIMKLLIMTLLASYRRFSH